MIPQTKNQNTTTETLKFKQRRCANGLKLARCLQRGLCWAHSMRNISQFHNKIPTPELVFLGIWNPLMSHLCMFFFEWETKKEVCENLSFSFVAKTVAKQKPVRSRRSSSPPWPPQKNWLSKMSLWPRFLTHLGHEFVEPPNWSLFFWSWPGIFWGTKSEPKIWGRPNLGSRFVYIWHMNKHNLNFNGIIYLRLYAAFSRGITLTSLCVIMLIF